MLIDCDTCAMRDLACGDCVVNALLGEPAGVLDLDADEQDALGALARGGLLPPLRLVPVIRGRPETSGDHSADVVGPPSAMRMPTSADAGRARSPARPTRRPPRAG
jgi:hypothetical protein